MIVAASATRRQTVQRMDRIVRPKVDGRAATFFVVYARGTQEDPEQGAHEVFVDEMLTVARSVQFFPGDAGSNDYLNWFLDGRSAGWRPPVVDVPASPDESDEEDVWSEELHWSDYVPGAGRCLACRRPVRSVEHSLNDYGVCLRCTFRPLIEDECDRCGHPCFEGWTE